MRALVCFHESTTPSMDKYVCAKDKDVLNRSQLDALIHLR